MSGDRFLNAIRCDRCGKSLETGKVESDNGDIICLKCAERNKMRYVVRLQKMRG